MRTLREYLGVLLAVCLVAVPGLLLPNGVRTAIERLLRETMVTPMQVFTSWALLRVREADIGRTEQEVPVDAGAHEEALRRKWQTLAPTTAELGLRSTPVYRAAFELAFRDRYEPLRMLVAAPVLSQRDESFREAMRLGCGRRQHLAKGAAVFTAEGYLLGVVHEVMLLTCTVSPLGTDGVRIPCDVLGRDGVQGILAGPWRQRTPGSPEVRPHSVELQIVSRGTAVSVGDAVVTSSFAGSPVPALLPGGIPVGWVDATESTEEGYMRARVRIQSPGSHRQFYIESRLPAVAGRSTAVEAAAVQARCLAELRRLLTFERDQVPSAISHLVGVRKAGVNANQMAHVAFAVRQRPPETFYEVVDLARPEALGLRPGVPCLSNGSLAGVTVAEGNALRLRLLTAPALPVSVVVLQPHGVRYPGVLAAVDGPQSRESVPEGWCLPGQPRLQVIDLQNEGLPVQLPAPVVTAAGGVVPLPPDIPVGTLVGDQGDPFAPCWLVLPYADFGALTYCIALVPGVAHAVDPKSGLQTLGVRVSRPIP